MNRAPVGPPSTSAPLTFDAASEAEHIVDALRLYVEEARPRCGLVVPMSGDSDSSLCASLAVRAVGADAVFGIMLPERESSSAALLAAVRWAEQLGIDYDVQDITSVLEVVGCYRRRDEIIRRAIPELRSGWTGKLLRVLHPGSADEPPRFGLAATDTEGRERESPLNGQEYRAILAAAFMKQRTRAMLAYYHADRLGYLVVGMADRLAHVLGLVAKVGDASADVMPIAHLHRQELRELAAHFGVPALHNGRSFGSGSLDPREWLDGRLSLPQEVMGDVLQAREDGQDAPATAAILGLPLDDVEGAFAEIDHGTAEAAYVHRPPQLIQRRVASHLASRGVDRWPASRG